MRCRLFLQLKLVSAYSVPCVFVLLYSSSDPPNLLPSWCRCLCIFCESLDMSANSIHPGDMPCFQYHSNTRKVSLLALGHNNFQKALQKQKMCMSENLQQWANGENFSFLKHREIFHISWLNILILFWWDCGYKHMPLWTSGKQPLSGSTLHLVRMVLLIKVSVLFSSECVVAAKRQILWINIMKHSSLKKRAQWQFGKIL